MNKFKALLTKEWHTHKKLVKIPFWITLGFYLLILIGVTIGYFKGDMNFQFSQFSHTESYPLFTYLLNLLVIMMPGFMSLIFTIIITQGALNEDIQKNCELFHRSQPISIWQRTAAKLIFGITSNWLVLLVISLVNFIIINTVLICLDQFEFMPAFMGFLQGSINYLKVGIIIGSIAFFFSAIFKDKAFFQGFAILLGIQFLFLILNAFFNWKLPLPLSYLLRLVVNHSINVEEINLSAQEVNNFISENWKIFLFNWKTLIQLSVSGVLFGLGTLLYKNKEIV